MTLPRNEQKRQAQNFLHSFDLPEKSLTAEINSAVRL